jgi:futalosine hydrolase
VAASVLAGVLIVCALRAELRGLHARAGADVLPCGVGPVEAAASVARALAGGGVRAVVNAGIAGAFSGRAQIGDAVIIAEERYADLGLESGEQIALPDGQRTIDRAFADDDLLERCAGLPYAIGSGLTVTRVTTTGATADRLARTYDADVESMEGFAVLRACGLAGVPALEIRGVSNRVGERALSGWDFGAGSRAVVAALEAVLDRLAEAQA